MFEELYIEGAIEHEYYCLARFQLVGIFLAIFVAVKHEQHLTNVYRNFQREGFVGLGNKGSVGISFKLYNTQFCFLNVHLPAHEKNVEERNASIEYIVANATFSDEQEKAYQLNASSTNPLPIANTQQGMHVKQHDYVFIVGDFNYRISPQGHYSIEDVKEKIEQERWSILRVCDQLSQELKRGKILKGFVEGEVNFAPTYKYKPGTNSYDKKKNRMPSWTDRIFYYSKSNAGVQLLHYGRFESLLSDHKPVSAYFLVKPVQSKLPPPPPTHLLRASGTNFVVPSLPPNKAPPSVPVTTTTTVITTSTTNITTIPQAKPRKPLPTLPPKQSSAQPQPAQQQQDLLDFSDFTISSTTTTTTNSVRNSVSQMPSLKHIKLPEQKRNTIGAVAAPTATKKFNPFDDPFSPRFAANSNPFDDVVKPQQTANNTTVAQGSVKNMISKFNTKR